MFAKSFIGGIVKIQVFSDKLVTKDNKNGKGIIDIDTPEGIAIFGGQKAVNKYKQQIQIQAKEKEIINRMAKDELGIT